MSIKLFLNTTGSEYLILAQREKSKNKSGISAIFIGVCTLRTHINHLFLKTFYGKLKKKKKKLSKKLMTFSFFHKKFPKIVYYCMPLGHTSI